MSLLSDFHIPGFFVPFIYLPDLAISKDISKSDAAMIVSIIGITNTIGRVLCGMAAGASWADPLKVILYHRFK